MSKRCKHKRIQDFVESSQSISPNKRCIDCGQRWYKNGEYTKEEWEALVNKGFEGRYHYTKEYWDNWKELP